MQSQEQRHRRWRNVLPRRGARPDGENNRTPSPSDLTVTADLPSTGVPVEAVRSVPMAVDPSRQSDGDRLGVRTLWPLQTEPVNPATSTIDFVAVHGLNGDLYNTWTDDSSGNLWLRDFLHEDIPDAHIMTFGYSSGVVFGGSVSRIEHFAIQLLEGLRARRRRFGTENNPLVFVCHSLGGIVFKKALIIAHARQSLYEDLLNKIYGVMFFGTPHHGADLAYWARILGRLANVPLLKSIRTDLLQDLERKSTVLGEICYQFVERATPLRIVTVYERRPIQGLNDVIVDESSALLNVPNERPTPIEANHMTMCKFRSRTSNSYELVASFLEELRDFAISSTRQKTTLDNTADSTTRAAVVNDTEPPAGSISDSERLSFAEPSASGYARQSVGNVINHINFTYTVQNRNSDSSLRKRERNTVFLSAAAEGQTPRVAYLLRLRADLDHTDEEGFTALHHACLSGFEDTVGVLLQAGADVNANSHDLGTPLCLAALRGREHIVALLLRYHAKVDKAGRWVGTPLHCASWVGSLEVTKLLLDHAGDLAVTSCIQLELLEYGCALGSTVAYTLPRKHSDSHHRIYECHPLIVAASRGHEAIVGHLGRSTQIIDSRYRFWDTENPAMDTFESIEAESKLSECTALMMAASRGYTEVVSQLLVVGATADAQDTSGRSALYHAAAKGNFFCVQKLVQWGATIDLTDDTSVSPLLAAVHQGNVHVVRYLIENRADIEATDKDGNAPCHVAVIDGQLDILRTLMANNASSSRTNTKGRTPLFLALRKEDPAFAECLISSGASTSERYDHGMTPLHYAVLLDNAKIVACLLDAGAVVTEVDDNDHTAADFFFDSTTPGDQQVGEALNRAMFKAHSRSERQKAQVDGFSRAKASLLQFSKDIVQEVEESVVATMRRPQPTWKFSQTIGPVGCVHLIHDPQLKLVAITSDQESNDEHIGTYRTQYRPPGLALELIATSDETRASRRLQQLVERDLNPYRIRISCTCNRCIAKPEGRVRHHWFRVSVGVAERTLRLWTDFILQNPYVARTGDDVGVLREDWEQKLRNRAPIAPFEFPIHHDKRLQRWATLLSVQARTDSERAKHDQPESRHAREADVLIHAFVDEEFIFMMRCTFSDHTHWNLWRSYEAFYEMHMALLDRFPEEAGKFPGTPRTLPYIPGPVETPTVAITEIRCGVLNKYVNELLKLGQHVVRSAVVTDFFAPRLGDEQIVHGRARAYTPT